MKPIHSFLVIAMCGCASTSPGTRVDAPIEPCNVAVPANSPEPWRLVRAEGFTFCLPTTWMPTGRRSAAGIDPRNWRSSAGSLAWNTGPLSRETAPYSVARADGSRASQVNERRFTEEISGNLVELWTIETGIYSTGAAWTTPMGISITGTAPDFGQAELQLNIYRTVRFTAR